MDDKHFTLVSRLTGLGFYRASQRLGEFSTTRSLLALVANDVSVEADDEIQTVGQVAIQRNISLRRELIDGSVRLDGVTVHIDGDSQDWAWTRRAWNLWIEGENAKGTIEFPALWGFFSFGPYIRVTIRGLEEVVEFDVGTPYLHPVGAVGHFRNRATDKWHRLFYFRESKPKGDVPLMFEEAEVFLSLSEAEGAILVAALMSLLVFSCYFSSD